MAFWDMTARPRPGAFLIDCDWDWVLRDCFGLILDFFSSLRVVGSRTDGFRKAVVDLTDVVWSICSLDAFLDTSTGYLDGYLYWILDRLDRTVATHSCTEFIKALKPFTAPLFSFLSSRVMPYHHDVVPAKQ